MIPIIGEPKPVLNIKQAENLEKALRQIGGNAAKLINDISSIHSVLVKFIAESKKK